MTTAFGYIRLSQLDEPDETTSPARQRLAIEKWCKDEGATLVDVFEDLDKSAYEEGVKRPKRPDFDRMMSRLGEVDVVVASRLDRLARSASGFHETLKRFEAAGVKFVTIDGTVNMTTANGRAMTQMTAVFAELESGNISERVRNAFAHKQKKGEWIGRVPYGFRLKGKAIELDPEKFAVLEGAARRYVGGESLRRISTDLGTRHTTLANRLRSDRVIDALPPGVGAALVEQLAERGRTGTRAKRSLLGGIARCGECGAGMTVVGERQGGWAAYACRERQHVSISKPWLDEYVSREVVDAIDTGRLVERIKKQRNRRSRAPVAKEIEARLELLEHDFYESGRMSHASYLRLRNSMYDKLDRARKAAAEEEAPDIPRELAEHLAERWADLELHTQRRIIAACAKEITIAKATSHGPVTPDRVSVEWRV
jgi:DNA invertase Pin-like site-specific DNA recombinase